jgi:transglutaminase-like putative cysteine protease
MDGALGIELRREPKETALAAPDKAATLDLATAIAIRPTGVALENPRALRRAEYEIRGLSKPLPVRSGSVQTVTHEPDGGGGATGAEPRLLARITVTTGPLPAGETARRFRAGQTVPDDLKPFLKATPYVPTADARFVALAGSVVGGETDLARAAAKIAAWTHRTVTPDPGIAALRTASDILQTPRGVCRDYTTLFTAVARAAGIPTKQCVGLAFADGRFLYHAWPEVWVGDNRWVALEPTWGAPFADATHIKLAEGEITDFFGAAADAGSLQIQVVRAATDSAR